MQNVSQLTQPTVKLTTVSANNWRAEVIFPQPANPYVSLVGQLLEDVRDKVSHLYRQVPLHRICAELAFERLCGVELRPATRVQWALILYATALRSHGLHLLTCFQEGLLIAELKWGMEIAEKLAVFGNSLLAKLEVGSGTSERAVEYSLATFIKAKAEELHPLAARLVRVMALEAVPVRPTIEGYYLTLHDPLWQKVGRPAATELQRGVALDGPVARVHDQWFDSLIAAARYWRELNLCLDSGALGYHPRATPLAEAIECAVLLDRVRAAALQRISDGTEKTERGPERHMGLGAVEAPRGILSHLITVDDVGRLSGGYIETPTMRHTRYLETVIAAEVSGLVQRGRDRRAAEERMLQLIRWSNPCFDCSGKFLNIIWN